MMKSIRRLFLAVLFITGACNFVRAQSADAILTWLPSPSVTNDSPSNMIGTFIYVWTGDPAIANVGTNYEVYDGGMGTNMILYGLTPGETYYFTGTAYDSYDDESDFCNEIQYTPPIGIGTNLVPVGYVTNIITLNAPVMLADEVYTNFQLVWTNPPEAAKFFRSGPLMVDTNQNPFVVNLPLGYLTNLTSTNWMEETNFSVAFTGDMNQLSAGNLSINEQSYPPILNYQFQPNAMKADSTNFFSSVSKAMITPPLPPINGIESVRPEQQLFEVTQPKKSEPVVVPKPNRSYPLLSPKMKDLPHNKPMKRR